MSLTVSNSPTSPTALGRAFSTHDRALCQVGHFIDHDQFFGACMRVSQAFKKTMEHALEFHYGSRERYTAFADGRAPFYCDAEPERLEFEDFAGMQRIYRNENGERTLCTSFSNLSVFSKMMGYFTKVRIQAVRLYNDWDTVSINFDCLMVDQRLIDQKIKDLSMDIMVNSWKHPPVDYIFAELQQLQESSDELAEKIASLPPSELRERNVASLHSMMQSQEVSWQKYQKRQSLQIAEQGQMQKLEVLLEQKKSIQQEIMEWEKKYKEFEMIRPHLRDFMQDKLCFFQDLFHYWRLLLDPDLIPEYPKGKENGFRILTCILSPIVPVSNRVRELIRTRTRLVMDGNIQDFMEANSPSPFQNLRKGKLKEQWESARKLRDSYALALLEDNVDRETREGLSMGKRAAEEQLLSLEEIFSQKEMTPIEIEGQYRYQVEQELLQERVPVQRLMEMQQIVDQEIGLVSDLSCDATTDAVKEYMLKRSASLVMEKILLNREIKKAKKSAEGCIVALRKLPEQKGEYLSAKIHIVSMTIGELHRWETLAAAESLELFELVQAPDINWKVKRYMRDRREAIKEEFIKIHQEIEKRRHRAQEYQKTTNEVLSEHRRRKEEIAEGLRALQSQEPRSSAAQAHSSEQKEREEKED